MRAFTLTMRFLLNLVHKLCIIGVIESVGDRQHGGLGGREVLQGPPCQEDQEMGILRLAGGVTGEGGRGRWWRVILILSNREGWEEMVWLRGWDECHVR